MTYAHQDEWTEQTSERDEVMRAGNGAGGAYFHLLSEEAQEELRKLGYEVPAKK